MKYIRKTLAILKMLAVTITGVIVCDSRYHCTLSRRGNSPRQTGPILQLRQNEEQFSASRAKKKVDTGPR